MRFGKLVETHRKRLGLTMEQLGKQVGIQKGYISGIEHGNVNPPHTSVIIKMARVFGLNEHGLVMRAYAEKAPRIIRKTLVGYAETVGI